MRGPASVLARSQLEGGAPALSALRRRPVEVSCQVKDQPSSREYPVGAAKVMQDVLGPPVLVRGQLEGDSPIVSAAESRRAVEVSCLVKDQPSSRDRPVGAVRRTEAMQHVLGPASVPLRGQLEDRALTVSAAARGRAVEIAYLVKGQPGKRPQPVGAPRLRAEAIESVLGPASVLVRGQLEDGAAVIVSAAGRSRAVEVSRLVKDQASSRGRPVGAVRERAEAIQHALGPASVLARGQSEDGAAAVIAVSAAA